MFFIVGLGNPGMEYEWSRHNLGFMLIDKLASDLRIEVRRRECQALVGRGVLEGSEVQLVKPQTFMNSSGEAVSCLLAKHESAASARTLIVISDDLALPFGRIRIRARGSAGGHNGLKSIIAAIGTDEFIRLRIGIQPEHPVTNAKRFVLDPMPKAARDEVVKILERSAEALVAIIKDGVMKTMSIYNSEPETAA
jgi:PTH1 family peptidyl-tRNA hydrolase